MSKIFEIGKSWVGKIEMGIYNSLEIILKVYKIGFLILREISKFEIYESPRDLTKILILNDFFFVEIFL